jgi:hypothetical protein
MRGYGIRRFAARWIIVVGFLVFLAPTSAFAVDKTRVGDIRAAINYATTEGICGSPRDSNSKPGCKRQKTLCNDVKWSEYIADNVEFRGGSPFQKEGTGALGVIGSAINPIAGVLVHTAGGERITDGDKLPDEVYSYLRKDARNRLRIVPLTEASCYCECGPDDTDIRCKEKNAGAPIPVRPSEFFTREECMGACAQSKRKIADLCAGSLAFIESIDIGSSEGQIAAQAAQTASNINALCFTTDECSKQDGLWEKYDKCKDRKGRCAAKEPVITLNTPIGGVTKIQGLNTYIVTFFRYMISIVAIVTTIMFIYGAFMYMLSSAIESIKKSKVIMIDAIVGLILVLGATTILRTINPDLLKLDPLKIFMVNTVQFIEAAYCDELDSGVKLADAGEPPSPKSYEEIASKEGSFSESPSSATCGHQYFVEGSIGQPCEGNVCKESNEACISCADSALSECQGIPGTRKVCAKLKFGGTINYANGRFPEEVYLLMICGYAEGAASVDIATANVKDLYEEDLAKVAHIVGTARTVEDIAGQAAYQFDLSSTALIAAASACSASGQGNGFKGAVVGVQYNDDTEIGTRYVQALATFTSANFMDDMAIVAKSDCGGGAKIFSGYSSGIVADRKDLARAMLCGFGKGKLKNVGQDYWSLNDLTTAALGDGPIICNFNLSSENAPSNPGEIPSFCKNDPNGLWRIDSSGELAEAVAAPGLACTHGEECPLPYGGCTDNQNRSCICMDWDDDPLDLNDKDLKFNCFVQKRPGSNDCRHEESCTALTPCTDTCWGNVGGGWAMECRCDVDHELNCFDLQTDGC